jgi:nucleotide-binding universal stress UspA family protein
VTRILLALDESPASRRAVEYAAGILPHLPGCEVLLLALAVDVPAGSEELDPRTPPPEVHGDEDHAAELQRLRAVLNAAGDRLAKAGLAEDRMRSEVRPLDLSPAEDIVAAATGAGCDTVIVGRRGVSRLRALVEGSVSDSLVHKVERLTVWVVA